jgi:hypothetical protein
VAVAPRTSNNVYILDMEVEEKFCLGQEYENFIESNKKEAVRDLPNIINPSNPICKHCQIGKKT